MSELVLLLLRIGFLVLMWFFVFGVVYSLRADLFGVRARKLPAEATAGAPASAHTASSSTAIHRARPSLAHSHVPATRCSPIRSSSCSLG